VAQSGKWRYKQRARKARDQTAELIMSFKVRKLREEMECKTNRCAGLTTTKTHNKE
jgi:hypothetical protein